MADVRYGVFLLACVLAVSLAGAADVAVISASTSAASSSQIATLVLGPPPGSPIATLVDGPAGNITAFCVNSAYPVCGGQCGRVKTECASFNEKTRLGFADAAQKCGCDCQAVKTVSLAVNESASSGDFSFFIKDIRSGAVTFYLSGSDNTQISATTLSYPQLYRQTDPASGNSISLRFTSIANGRAALRIYRECPAGQYYDISTCKCKASTERLASAGTPGQIRANVTLPACFNNCPQGSTFVSNFSECYCWPLYTPKPLVKVPGSNSYAPQSPGASIITPGATSGGTTTGASPGTGTTPGTPGTGTTGTGTTSGTGTTPGKEPGTGTGPGTGTTLPTGTEPGTGTTPGAKNGTTPGTGATTGTTSGATTGTGTGTTSGGTTTGTGTTTGATTGTGATSGGTTPPPKNPPAGNTTPSAPAKNSSSSTGIGGP